MTASVATLPVTPQTTGLTMEIMKVTPSMAEKWLGKNVKNRNLSQRDVIRYAGMMSRGEWLITGEGVKFAATGELLDGQHRLAAIVHSGKPIQLLVVRGLHGSVQDVLDTGRARTAADALSIHGFSNPTLLAAAARIAIVWEKDLFYKDTKSQQISHRQIIEFASQNAMLGFACAKGHSVAKAADVQPSICSMAFFELLKIDDEKAAEFFDRLADGVNLPAGSPILALRARLRTLRDERTSLPTEAKVALIFRTWNAWVEGQRLANLPLYYKGELIKCPEPKKPARTKS